jgi:hypothetical protein
MEDIVSCETFLLVLWIGTAVCTVCFAARAYIRYVCFGRLLLEDWFMLGALLIQISTSIVWQMYLQDMYNMAHAVLGTFVPGPTFLEDMRVALIACGVMSITVYIGLWLIKASFLVLFYRLGHKIPLYLYAWWVGTALIMACGIASLGLNQYQCMFGDINVIFATCLQPESLHEVYVKEVAAATLDIFSDLLIIIFPVWILWSTRVSVRQKLVLSAIFCLVGLTVAMTIVRGVFARTIAEDPKYALQQINIAWVFWFLMEYLTSFLVACAISFRSLFVQSRTKQSADSERRRVSPTTPLRKRRVRYYLDKLYDSVLTTARYLEGDGCEHETWKLPEPESGLMTVDFSTDEGWRRHYGEDGDSVRALKPYGNSGTVVVGVAR